MAKPTKRTENLSWRGDVPWMDWTHLEPVTGRFLGRYRMSLNKVAGRKITLIEDAKAVMQRTMTAIREGRWRGTLEASEQTDEQIAQARPLRDVIAEYREHHISKLAATSNIVGAVNRLAKHLGDRPIASLQLIDLERYFKGLENPEKFTDVHKEARTRTPGAINQHIVRIGHLFTWAIERGFLTRSPMEHQHTRKRLIKKLKGEQPRDVTLTPEEQERVIAAAAASVMPPAADWITFALDTGLRRGEQFGRFKRPSRRNGAGAFDATSGIRVRDWNPFTNKLTVRAIAAKTRKDREVPIATERTRKMLRELCAPGGVARPPNDLIFVTIDGTPVYVTTALRRLNSACRDAQVRKIRWHDLRHTFASDLYYRCGVPLQVVQKVLGHSTIQMTMTYLNVTEAGIDAALSGLDGLRKRDTATTQEGASVAQGA
jgi:integrase